MYKNYKNDKTMIKRSMFKTPGSPQGHLRGSLRCGPAALTEWEQLNFLPPDSDVTRSERQLTPGTWSHSIVSAPNQKKKYIWYQNSLSITRVNLSFCVRVEQQRREAGFAVWQEVCRVSQAAHSDIIGSTGWFSAAERNRESRRKRFVSALGCRD